jgi:hypothetical protein
MKDVNSIRALSDDQLLSRIAELVSQSRRTDAELVAHIAEVDERRLYASRACSSMFVYAVEVLHLSEHAAYERIAAARASRKYPKLLAMLSDGRLHLSGLGKLAPHLTDENCEALMARAAYKSKREIEELLAELSPKPDVPAVIRKLPAPPISPSLLPAAELGPDRVPAPRAEVATPPMRMAPPPKPPVVEPLAPSRYKIQFTASKELRDKLERLQSLVDGDLAAVIEAAVTEKLARLEAKRYASTNRSRRNVKGSAAESLRSRYIPAALKRAVVARDGGQCAFLDGNGRRCTARNALEFHHHEPYGYGGAHNPENISLRCKTHNLYAAEQDYGTELMRKYRPAGRRVSESPP